MMLVDQRNPEEGHRRRGFRLFRRNQQITTPSANKNNNSNNNNNQQQELLGSIPSDQYGKFNRREDFDRQTRSTVIHPRAKTKKEFKNKQEIVLAAPPSAREAAFGGPVRYDWIDIETRAAILVQAAYRRNKVMNDLERQGITTGAIRNRARRREAESSSSFLDCCGYYNFSFADFALHDREAHREYQKMVYHEKKKACWEKDDHLRSGFSNRWSAKQAAKNQTEEAIEVME